MTLAVNDCFAALPNAAKFEAMMTRAVETRQGRIYCAHGRAGRGKTTSAIRWHSKNNSSFLRALIFMARPEQLLSGLCRALGMPDAPHRVTDRWAYVSGRLADMAAPLIIDEIEKLPPKVLECVRDIADQAGVPVVLLGEEELYHALLRNRRVWSRVSGVVEFLPLSPTDTLAYCWTALGGNKSAIGADAAKELADAAGGDLRLIERDLRAAARIANAKGSPRITAEIAQAAVKAGLRPGPGKGARS